MSEIERRIHDVRRSLAKIQRVLRKVPQRPLAAGGLVHGAKRLIGDVGILGVELQQEDRVAPIQNLAGALDRRFRQGSQRLYVGGATAVRRAGGEGSLETRPAAGDTSEVAARVAGDQEPVRGTGIEVGPAPALGPAA